MMVVIGERCEWVVGIECVALGGRWHEQQLALKKRGVGMRMSSQEGGL